MAGPPPAGGAARLRGRGGDGRLPGDHDARLAGAEARRAQRHRRRHRAEPEAGALGEAPRPAQGAEGRPPLDQRASRQGSPERGARCAGLPHRRRARVRRQRRLLPRQPGLAAVQPQVRRGRHRDAPARARRSSRSSTRPRSSGGPSRRARCCSTSRPSSRRGPTGRPGTPTASTAGRSSCGTRSRCRSTCPRSVPSSASAARRSRHRRRSWACRFAGGEKAFLQAGLAGAIGTVEVRPIDLASAYGTLANGGVRVPPRMILEIRDAAGNTVWAAPEPDGERAISATSAYLVTNILEGNTDPRQNEIWAEKLDPPQRPRRPAPPGRGQDRHLERRSRPRDLRLPRAAEGQGRPGLGRRRVDGQQRSLDAADPDSPPPRSPRPHRCGRRSCAS